MSLSDYLADTADLLHDTAYRFTTQRQLTRYVNEGRRIVARRTGCVLRLISGQSAWGAGAQPGSLIPGGGQPGAVPEADPGALNSTTTSGAMQTIPGVERYPYIGFFNPYAKQQHAGIDGVIDAVSLSVNWGGSVRPSLDWMPWDNFQAYCRAYAALVTTFPMAWSVFNDGPMGEIWMFPAPSQAGDIELMASCIPTDLVTDDDFDVIPEGLRFAVRFAAAELAMTAKEKYAQAAYFGGKLTEAIGQGTAAFDKGKTPSYYTTAFDG